MDCLTPNSSLKLGNIKAKTMHVNMAPMASTRNMFLGGSDKYLSTIFILRISYAESKSTW